MAKSNSLIITAERVTVESGSTAGEFDTVTVRITRPSEESLVKLAADCLRLLQNYKQPEPAFNRFAGPSPTEKDS